MNRIKVGIVDDNERIISIIKDVLALESDMEVCDEAQNFEKAKEIIQASRPDILVLDISLDEHDGGFKLLRELSSLSASTKAIILSAHDEFSFAAKSLQAGAKGYVCKDKMVRCLADAIRSVHAGQEFVSSTN